MLSLRGNWEYEEARYCVYVCMLISTHAKAHTLNGFYALRDWIMSSHYPAVSAIISSLSLLYAQFTPSTSRLSVFLKQLITFEQIVLRFGEITNIFFQAFLTST